MRSHSKEFPVVNAASAVKNLLELRGLPRLDQEVLHQRIWREQSGKIRRGYDGMDFCSIPGHSILIFAAMELLATILDLSQQ